MYARNIFNLSPPVYMISKQLGTRRLLQLILFLRYTKRSPSLRHELNFLLGAFSTKCTIPMRVSPESINDLSMLPLSLELAFDQLLGARTSCLAIQIPL